MPRIGALSFLLHMNTCWFCGPTEAELTKEELWPKWFSKFLVEVFGRKRRYRATRTVQQEVLNTWRPWNIDVPVGGFCKPCNNERLSTLENDFFKPLLKRMCFSESLTLSVGDQATLIAWITRFTMVADIAHLRGDPPFFSSEERKQFIETLLPPEDAWIWIGLINSSYPAGCTFTRLFYATGSMGLACTGIVGPVAFQFHLRRWIEPQPSFEQIVRIMQPTLTAFAPATIRLFPNDDQPLTWPPPKYLERGGFEQLARRWGGDIRGLP
jgi:hypothetical protein